MKSPTISLLKWSHTRTGRGCTTRINRFPPQSLRRNRQPGFTHRTPEREVMLSLLQPAVSHKIVASDPARTRFCLLLLQGRRPTAPGGGHKGLFPRKDRLHPARSTHSEASRPRGHWDSRKGSSPVCKSHTLTFPPSRTILWV